LQIKAEMIELSALTIFLLGVLGGMLLLILIQFLICQAYWKTFEHVGRIPQRPPPAVESHPVQLVFSLCAPDLALCAIVQPPLRNL
jgi:hypothetical protein